MCIYLQRNHAPAHDDLYFLLGIDVYIIHRTLDNIEGVNGKSHNKLGLPLMMENKTRPTIYSKAQISTLEPESFPRSTQPDEPSKGDIT